VSLLARWASRAVALVPTLPWYGWALGAAALVAIATAARAAGAASELPARPAGAPPVLKRGSSGEWVTYLQALLAVEPTGIFDDATASAVHRLQADRGLTADEIVGPATWGALGVSGSVSAPAPAPGPAPAPPSGATSGNPFGLAEDIPTRDAQILGYVQNGAHDLEWVPLSWSKAGHSASILVSRRALAIVSGSDRLTVNATYKTAQAIADAVGGAMMTTRIADEIDAQAAQRLPVLSKAWQGPNTDNSGSKLFRMYDQSADIASRVTSDGKISNEGKDWVLTPRFWDPNEGALRHHSANFGWYGGKSTSPGGRKVVQSVGLMHDMGHTDYSQLLRFVRPDSLVIDGQSWDYAAALADPSVSSVLHDEPGIIPGARHPDL
jgi:hypothetical protein